MCGRRMPRRGDAGGRRGGRPATAGWEGDPGGLYGYVNQLRRRRAKASLEFVSSGVTGASGPIWDVSAGAWR